MSSIVVAKALLCELSSSVRKSRGSELGTVTKRMHSNAIKVRPKVVKSCESVQNTTSSSNSSTRREIGGHFRVLRCFGMCSAVM